MAKKRPVVAKAPRSKTPAMWSDYLLAAMCLLAPVLWHVVARYAGMTTRAEGVDVSAAILGACGIAAAVVLGVRATPLPLRRHELALVALLGFSLVSSLASGRGWTAFVGEVDSGLGWLALVAFATVVAASSSRASALRSLVARVAPWLVLGETAMLGLQLAGVLPGSSATLPNSTYLGEMFVVLLPWVLLGWDGEFRGGQAWRLAVAGAAVIALGASGSRTAVAVAVVWLVWMLVRRLKASVWVRAVIAGSVAILAAGATFVFARSELLGSATLATLGERPELWNAAVRGALARPLLGWGPDGFIAGGSAASTVEAARAGRLVVLQPLGQADPHSALMWVAVSMGLAGVVLVGWLVFEMVRETRGSVFERAAGSPAMWALGMFGVVAMTAPAAIQILPLVALVWGVAVDEPGSCPDGVPEVAGVPTLGTRIAALLAGTCCIVLASYAATAAPLEVADPQRSPTLADRAQRAAQRWPVDARLAFIAARHAALSGSPDPSSLTLVIDGMSRATQLDSRNPYYPLYLAVTLRDTGAAGEQVESSFDEAFSRYPFHPFARAERALYYARTGQAALALQDLEIASLVDFARVPEMTQLIDAAKAQLTAEP